MSKTINKLASLRVMFSNERFVAASNGDLKRVMDLISAGNVDALSNTRWTALQHAAESGQPEVVSFLIRQGANVNVISEDLDGTPLWWAAANGFVDVAKLLLASGADASIPDGVGYLPLHIAAQDNRYECLRLVLLPHLAHCTTEGGWTALHLAARNDSIDCLHLLIDSGIHVDALDDEGNTALALALEDDHREVAGLLIDLGAKIENVTREVEVPKWCKDLVCCREACRAASRAILELQRRASAVLGRCNGRDVLGLISVSVWSTRFSEQWVNNTNQRKRRR